MDCFDLLAILPILVYVNKSLGLRLRKQELRLLFIYLHVNKSFRFRNKSLDIYLNVAVQVIRAFLGLQ